MTEKQKTPCGVMFDTMKRWGGLSYKETASLILSGRPMGSGLSPASRANDRSWLSRFIVNAPVASLHKHYFGDPAVGAMRLISRLKSEERRMLTSEDIIQLVCHRPNAMMAALKDNHQDVSLYNNFIERIVCQSALSEDEKAELAMVFYVALGCSANTIAATRIALEFSRNRQRSVLITPPSVTVDSEANTVELHEAKSVSVLGLIRIKDGHLIGMPHWIPCESAGVIIGALATGEEDITDVERDVSGHHAGIWCDDSGLWRIADLGSRNGTYVIRSANGARVEISSEVFAVTDSLKDLQGMELFPGDELMLGRDTAFMAIKGAPNVSW